MSRSSFLVETIIILIIIIFLQLFSYIGINVESNILSLAVFGCGIFMILISGSSILFKKGLKFYSLDILIILFITSIFLSFLTALGYWHQSFGSSLLSYRLFYIYFLYFLFIHYEFSQSRVEFILLAFFFLSLIVFSIDYLTFPDPLFSLRTEERRNGITIFFNGQGFTFLGAFYYLQKFYKNHNPIYFLWFLVGAFFLFFLTQSRMNLLGLGVGFIFILYFSSIRYKYILTITIMLIAICFYFSSSAFEGIKEENAEQAKYYTKDVRVHAQSFFLTELQGGWPTMVFGNGIPAKGSKLEAMTNYGIGKGYYTSDVGLTGIFSFFGIFGLLIWVIFFYKSIFMNDHQNLSYVKAYFLTILITAFTGYSIFDPGYMPATILALYLVRCNTEQNFNKYNGMNSNIRL